MSIRSQRSKLAVKALRDLRCGAKRKYDGQPCQLRPHNLAFPFKGNLRCKFHGGLSTGPKTPDGIAQLFANLRKGWVKGPRKPKDQPKPQNTQDTTVELA